MKMRLELIASIGSLVSLIAGFLVIGVNSYERANRPPARADVQIERIQRVNNDLRDLLLFFEEQQRNISRGEEIVEKLRQEEKNTRPLIDANRETIDAVLDAQAEKQKQSIWTERLIGFLFGTAGSLIASVVLSRFQRSRETETA